MPGYPLASIAAGAAGSCVAAASAACLVARAGFPLPRGSRLGCVDGLRGVLAVSVLIHHFVIRVQLSGMGRAWGPPSVNLLNQLGAGAVALFFMATGFVFYPRVLAGFRACSWRRLYVARLFRIMPMVVVSVAAVTAFIAVQTGRGLDWAYAASAAVWLTAWDEPPLLGYAASGEVNAFVLWSLWYEWLFYLFVLPGCALAMDLVRGRLPSWTVPAALLGAGFAARALHAPGSIALYLPLFATGMLGYEARRREEVARVLRGRGAGCAGVAVLAFAMLATPNPYGIALPCFGMFFAVVACGNDLGGVLRTRAALVLGECSFSIYLLHGIVLSVVFLDGEAAGGAGLPVAMLVAAAGVVAVAATAVLFVERPAIRAGRRLADAVAGAEVPWRDRVMPLVVAEQRAP